MAVVRCVVQATPERVMAYWNDDRNAGNQAGTDMIESSYTVKAGVILFPVSVPTISDRESCYREFYTPTQDEDNSFINVSYTVSDERRPEVKGRVRVDALSCTTVNVLPGSNGNASECFRMFKFNPHVRQRLRLATFLLSLLTLTLSQFHGALGFINSIVALKASELIAKPLETLRTKVEGLIYEYEVLNGPSLAEVTFEGFDHNGKYHRDTVGEALMKSFTAQLVLWMWKKHWITRFVLTCFFLVGMISLCQTVLNVGARYGYEL